ncbi:MAG: FIST N-terminal domain-containing protein [Anaerolineae bacterium]|nr:FIST N-terminal domain-containing protein [Anaerolineae bacterium]
MAAAMRFVAAHATEEMLFARGESIERCDPATVVALLLAQMSAAPPFDWAVCFFTAHFMPIIEALASELCEALGVPALIGCSAESVITTEHELEQHPAITVLAARTPGVRVKPFALQAHSAAEWATLLSSEAAFREHLVGAHEPRLFILLVDPFTVPLIGRLPQQGGVLEAFNRFYAGVPVVGGVASGASVPGANALLLNRAVLRGGAVGLALEGNVQIDVVVSQGCRPIGRPFRVTRTHQHFILQLDEAPPFKQLEALIESLSRAERERLVGSLLIGRLVQSEIFPPYSAFGRGDFVVRSVLGGDPETGALAVGDLLEVGDIVQFHLRDAQTAREDLEMLLAPQALLDPPKGMLLFACNGRGMRLYPHADGDVRVVQAALGESQDRPVPLAGFFCGGEIGPIRGRNFLHSYTASLAIFRPARA